MDSAGNLYIADTGNNCIREVSSGMIATVAGDEAFGFSGDGGPATSASLYSPGGVAVDSGGNLYIADTYNERIRKVLGGTITTIAGNGEYRFSGDGGPATSASLNEPTALAVDSTGNVYIADYFNNRIRKVSNGTIATVAGDGSQGFSSDGVPATGASLYYPAGVAVDSAGNLYIADTSNNRIRKVSNGTITTVAGNGLGYFAGDGGPAISASLDHPNGVAIDSTGSLYIADSVVRKVSKGTITTVAGDGSFGFSGDGGLAASASLSFPEGVAIDSAGNLYIADVTNNRIREVLVAPPFFGSPIAAGVSSLSLSQASGGKPVAATLTADTGTAASSLEAVPGMAYTANVTRGNSWL